MDLTTAFSAWESLKEIGRISQGIFKSKVNDEVKKEVQLMIDKSSELYDRIVKLEEDLKVSRESITELKSKINRAKQFRREFKKYVPNKLVTDSFVYSYNSLVYTDKPPHHICTNCVHDEIISVLQPTDKGFNLICHKCKSSYIYRSKQLSVNNFPLA